MPPCASSHVPATTPPRWDGWRGAAGVTRTVLYDHFPSKRALYGALLQENHATLLSHMRETITADAPFRERIEATFDALPDVRRVRGRWRGSCCSPITRRSTSTSPPISARLQSESNRLMAALLAPDAKRAGIEPDSTSGQAIFAIHQASLQALVKWWHAHPGVPRSELTQALDGRPLVGPRRPRARRGRSSAADLRGPLSGRSAPS